MCVSVIKHHIQFQLYGIKIAPKLAISLKKNKKTQLPFKLKNDSAQKL